MVNNNVDLWPSKGYLSLAGRVNNTLPPPALAGLGAERALFTIPYFQSQPRPCPFVAVPLCEEGERWEGQSSVWKTDG